MQEAKPYSIWRQFPTSMNHNNVIEEINGEKGDHVKRMVKDNAVIVFAKKGCCLSHVAKGLLQRVGANPNVYEVDEKDEKEIMEELKKVDKSGGDQDDLGRLELPAVFIGGLWFGGLDRVIITHIKEELTPLLKQAGALWL